MNRTKAVAWMVGAGLAALLAGCGGGATGNATISGSVSGLAANASVVLTDNGKDSLTVTGNGSSNAIPFSFAQTVPSQTGYNVQVATQPADQFCTVSYGSGLVDYSGNSIGNVAVVCSNNPTISAEVSGLDSGNSVVLSLTLQNDPANVTLLTVSSDGAATPFTDSSGAITLPLGTQYAVAVSKQPTNPAQVCVASTSASGGVVNSNAITVGFTCQ